MIARSLIDRHMARLKEVEQRLSDPDVAANQKAFRELIREHTTLKKLEEKAGRYIALQDELAGHRELMDSPDADEDLKELARMELDGLEASFQKIEKEVLVALLPPDPTRARNAVMEIRAGTGGNEAALFAGDLYRMYARYAEGRGWKISLVDAAGGDVGGYKEVVFTVKGDGAYGTLRYESGGHRVQRVPATESQGRIHTSAATVAVFPEAEADDDIEIKPEELRIDIFCSSGPGGQSVNTTYSAVRVTHLPTGVSVQSQDERSQHRNKDKCMAVLKSRLLDFKRREEEKRMGVERRSLIGSGDRSERIRTYNFPQNRLSDHRINLTLYSLDRIIEGDLEEVFSALSDYDVQLRLEGIGKKEDARAE